MKVTVYFGNVRVIVPCGAGDVLVRDLMDMAITRYKKATGKPSSSIIRIRNLKSSRDDGILYPDDKLYDVADDREQIIADFDENFSTLPHFNCGGDGTSTSSVCTGSPDMFSVEISSHGSVQYVHSDVEITEDSPPSGVTPLQVRRGSEPALNSLCPPSPTSDPSKRWSTAVVINPASPEKQKTPPDEGKAVTKDPAVTNGEQKPIRNFSRGSGRLSILGNSQETYRWVEAADRQLMKDLNDKLNARSLSANGGPERDAASDCSSTSEERERTIILKNESGPLAIHVVPDCDSKGRDTGLVIQSIEAGGRIDRDGRFCVGDRIVEINGQSLRGISFQTAHEVFKEALKAPQIKLELVRGSDSKTAAVPRKPPPPVYPKPFQTINNEAKKSEDEIPLVEGEERGGVTTKVATVTPTKKIPAVSNHRLAAANTRRMGKKYAIQLTKGSAGLGFSITTRDNPAGGSSPIYIKNVLSKGAAIEDGRLKPGDRLLEVNGIEMTGKTQAEAVQILRNTQLGGVVDMVVSRQEIDSPPNSELETTSHQPAKVEEEAGIFPWKHREILTFQIPLCDTGSAGLGVSVKGKSTAVSSGSVDLGIFIKSIIPGGAASKDGRLQPNDQLVNINGISLLGISNSDAMETLRKAMTQMDGPIPNNIILTVARRISQPSEDEIDSSSVHSKLSNVNSQGSVLSNGSDRNNDRRFLPKEVLKSSESCDSSVSVPSNHLNPQLSDIQKLDSNPPGCNPILERLTGRTANGHFNKLPSESYLFNMNSHNNSMPFRSERNDQIYSPTICLAPPESVMIEGEYSPSALGKLKTSVSSESAVHCNDKNISSDGIVLPASSQLSLDEINAGFSRDGFGRQSMSEKRHAQLDAKNTDTYQRNKKAREDRERDQQFLEQEYSAEHHHQLSSQGRSESHLSNISPVSPEDEPRGPSLGLRKSSSLESLQTMIQELNKDDEAMKKAVQSTSSRASRSRGCNESFRAAVDRSYEAPPPSAMETLDEESESGSSVGHILGRAVELADNLEPGITRDPFSDDALNLYCRSSKSSKKKSLLKGLGSVFKFGKSRKGALGEGKGKFGDDASNDGELSSSQLSQTSSGREQERISDQDHKILMDGPKKPLPSVPRESSSSSMSEPIANRQERMQNLREQHQRLHQKRQGHYPLEQKEELYESQIQAKEGKLHSATEIAHTRSHSHDEILNKNGNRPPFSEPGRYSHYMNYKEIQMHMTQYYHHDQVAKVPYAQNHSSYPAKNVPHPERPNSNYFEYESVQQLQRHAANQITETDTSSLPRSSHLAEHTLPHIHAQTSKHFYNNGLSGGYDRRNVHHYYPNNNGLYSHVVPGSKV